MSNAAQLVATPRDAFGKGVARKLRAAGQTPVVAYGHGSDPLHLTVETHPLALIVRHANALIELDINGKKQLVLVKDVQRDPVRQIIEHVDLLIVKKGEVVEVEVPVVLVGESFSGTNALLEASSLRLSVPATNIPEHIEVSVQGLEEGAQIHAADVKLASDEKLLDDGQLLVAHVVALRAQATESSAETTEGTETTESE